MRPNRKTILASAATVALVGVVGFAVAEIKNAHTLEVRLSDGSLAHIRYVGDTPPMVSFGSAPMALSVLSPASDVFDEDLPFAALEGMSRAMDREAATMIREARAQSGQASTEPDLTGVDVGRLPPGARGFSMVSTMSADGVCTRSVEYRSLGDGRPAQIVTRASGVCATQKARTSHSPRSASVVAMSRPEDAGRQPV